MKTPPAKPQLVRPRPQKFEATNQQERMQVLEEYVAALRDVISRLTNRLN
jgi:hypothetical protein